MNQELHEVEFVEEQEVEQDIGGLYYRIIRMKTGEEIVCGLMMDDTNYTCKRYITVHNPMIPDGKSFKPWSLMSSEDVFEISTDMIRSIYRIKLEYEEIYLTLCDLQYFDHLREMLKDGNLTDEERYDIEDELENAYDGSQDMTEEEKMLHGMETSSKLIH